jgi:hypothetical protein
MIRVVTRERSSKVEIACASCAMQSMLNGGSVGVIPKSQSRRYRSISDTLGLLSIMYRGQLEQLFSVNFLPGHKLFQLYPLVVDCQ